VTPNWTHQETPAARKLPIGEASLLPPCAGVYLFSDRHGNVLYVGKANDLRRRVAQHVREGLGGAAEDAERTRRERILMTSTHQVAWLPADTELEALLLEDSLIKTHRPSYNRRQNKFTRQVYLELLPDGESHAVRITDHPAATHSYGPFSDRFYARRLMAVLDERFGVAPRIGGGLRGMAPQAAAAERFLLGHDDGLIPALREEIERLASNLEFERAATVRDQLSFCESFLRRQAFVLAFTFGALVVSESRPQGSEHYLFEHGRLVARASRGVPESWAGKVARAGFGPPEPRWLLFERALVVYTWLNSGSGRKGVRILTGDGS
jgi:excinuclease UvrABC nuclease subunit